jgi:hypothetical protein
MKFLGLLLCTTGALALTFFSQPNQQEHADPTSEEGFGRVHMDISCSPSVGAEFDRALALLHNFWYARALARFNEVAKKDPNCAMAYWGEAMTYNHPFWDPPSKADETAAWELVQKGITAQEASPREKLYLSAVAALYKDAGAGNKSTRDQNYRDAMAAAYAQDPDDETALFYGLSILGAVPAGSSGFQQQEQAGKLFEGVYARQPDHPAFFTILFTHMMTQCMQSKPCRPRVHTRNPPRLCPILSICPRIYSRASVIGMNRRRPI